jgi:hypothetical protein
MSKFFDSDIVKENLNELSDLQEKIATQIFEIPFLDVEKRKEHLQLMKEFLEKQKLMFVRLSLSDDPEAIETKNNMMRSAKILGLRDDQNINDLFDILQKTIDKLEIKLNT